MAYFVSFNHIEFSKSIVLGNFLIVAVLMTLLRLFYTPITCSLESIQSLTADDLLDKCFRQSTIDPEDLYTQYYKFNFNNLALWLWSAIAAFCLIKIIYYRTQPEIKLFRKMKNLLIRKSSNLKTIEDEESMNESGKESLAESVDRLSLVRLHLYSYYIAYFCIIFLVQGCIFNINSILGFNSDLGFSFEWLSILAENKFKCAIEDPESSGMRTSMSCYLKYNGVFEIFLTLIWLSCLALLILNTISFIQLVLLTCSKSLRIKRIFQILPAIDELSCLELGSDTEFFFKIHCILTASRKSSEFESKTIALIREKFGLNSLNSLIYDSKLNSENNIELNGKTNGKANDKANGKTNDKANGKTNEKMNDHMDEKMNDKMDDLMEDVNLN